MLSFQEITAQLSQATSLMQENLPLVLAIIGTLYAIHFLNFLLGYRLNILGIIPRNIFGLCGVVFSPVLHGHFNHLFFNSIPLFILLSLMLLFGWDNFICATIYIFLLSGLGTWIIGRKGIHVGASGVIMGYWSYLMVNAYYNPSIVSFVLAIICIYYLGSLVFNLFPTEVKSSWEAHICGFLSGIAAQYLCINFPLNTYF